MPKLIDNLREDLIAAARMQMLGPGGYDSLTIRSVASSCDIAVGTFYNYFSSKDHLAACVMLEDWDDLVSRTTKKIKGKPPLECIGKLFSMISDFSLRYGEVWSQYRAVSGKQTVGEDYRHGLVVQVQQLVAGLFASPAPSADLTTFIAELLLRFGSDGHTDYKDIRPFIEKLLA